jgi:3-phosphoshikimate 1-carboxyvinyltransferase
MAAPGAKSSVDLRIDGTLVSQPYVRMTLAVMSAFGAHANASESLERLQIAAPQTYKATEDSIEPDASAASYFWALAAVTGGEVTVAGLTRMTLQGDVAFVDCLAKMGCEVRENADSITIIGRPLQGIDVDMNAISDTVQTLAVVALFANGPTAIRNVGHIRHKETDRIAALANELRKLGAEVDEHADGLTITPNALRPATVETYHDHRMAMSFALAGLRTPGVCIADPGCVAKTFPGYFDELTRAIKQR